MFLKVINLFFKVFEETSIYTKALTFGMPKNVFLKVFQRLSEIVWYHKGYLEGWPKFDEGIFDCYVHLIQ